MADMHDDLNFGVNLNSEIANEVKAVKNGGTTQRSSGSQDHTLQSGEKAYLGTTDYDLSAASHPAACIFTFAFKMAAFVIYFFGGIFFSSILVFIFVVILGSLDFWTVKNVTGRLLVGLRWWSDYDEKGNEIWKFESHNNQFKSNPVDKTFFWTSQVAFTLLWTIFLIIKILGLSFYWALLVCINLSLCGINLYGYYRCRGDHSKKLQNMAQQYKQKGLIHLAGKFI